MTRKSPKTQALAITRMCREGNDSIALKMPTHYKWGILLVFLTVCLRLPAIVHPKAIDDEAGYATVAHELLHGGTLYISALDCRPPLRIPTFTFTYEDIHTNLELTLFVEAGQVFHTWAELSTKNVQTVSGVGLRLVVTSKLVAKIDIGFGSEGIAIFTGLDYPF
jgi:hypothetical protein